MTVSRLRRTLSPIALVCALTAGPAARAQQAPADPASDSASEVVITAQRANQTQVIRGGQLGVLGNKDAADVPFSIKSYNAALILNQQPQSLGQVLENDPTIRTTYGFGNAAEQFVIRGFTLYGDDIGLDGLYGITPRQLIAPELYEQVQVLNGASAFLNGAAPGGTGLGGSVNLTTKRAGETDLYRFTANFTQDAHVGGAFDVSHRFAGGTIGLRLNGALRGGDVAVDNEYRRAAVLGGALDYRGADVRLSLDLGYQKVRIRNLRPKVTIASASIPEAPKASHNYGQAFSYSDLRDVFGIAHGEWDIAPDVMLYGSIGARDGSEQGIYDSITVTDAQTGVATGNGLYVPRTDNNEAAQAGVRAKIVTGAITHELNLGASAIHQVNRNAYDFRYGPGFAGYATNLYDTPAVALPSSTLVGGDLADPFPIARTTLRSLFASDTIGLFEGRLLITGGLRLQGISARGYSYTDGTRTSRYKQDAVTPVIGVVIKPAEGVSLFANRIQGLQQGAVAPLDATIVNPGEVFAPFKSTQYEVGGKLAIGRFNTSLAVYQTTQPTAYAAPDARSAPLLRYGLFGKQRNRGVEFSVDGEVARGLRVIAGGSINDAKLRNTAGGINDGNRAQGVPTYLANANVEWDLPFLRGATLTGRVVQTGRQQVNPANTLSIPSWTRVDLGARYVLLVGDRAVTLRVGVDNVANRRYWASAYDSFNAALLQGAPRTAKLSASIDL